MELEKKWYLLKVDNPLDHTVEITVKPTHLLTAEQVVKIVTMQ